jgi:hypothetical protein
LVFRRPIGLAILRKISTFNKSLWYMLFTIIYIYFIYHLWFNLGKDIVKGATQVWGHSLKLYFCMFKSSKGNHNNLDYHEFFWDFFSLIENFTCSKLDTNQFFFACSKHSNLKSGQSLFFSNIFIFIKCAPFFLKIGEDF